MINGASTLKYDSPAKAWTQCMPIGNGTLGAMIYGGVKEEKLALNHDELWTGYPRNTCEGIDKNAYYKARELALEGKLHEAEAILEKDFLGQWSQAYMPLGDLTVTFDHCKRASDYLRTLDLENSVSTVEYKNKGVKYTREYIASCPDKVIAARYKAEGGKLAFEVRLSSQLRTNSYVRDGILWLEGECPSENNENNESSRKVYYLDDKRRGIQFKSGVKILTDGKIIEQNTFLRVEDAEYAELFFTCETSFNGFDKLPLLEGKEFAAPCAKNLENAASYAAIKENHLADYRALYSRVSLDLGANDADSLCTDKRLKKFGRTKNDPSLITLVYNFGRYLSISSSREGSQPSTLQGIWNDKITPPWHSNYTVNINTEMNYWPVLMCNMPEVNLPLIKMLQELAVTGERAAREIYGVPGCCSHHNVDIWRLATPVNGSCVWAFWPCSSGWMSRHAYEHYEYTNDIDYLRDTAYPLLRKNAEFFDAMLVEYNGEYIFAPSTSPENDFVYQGDDCSIAKTSTMTMSIVLDVFTNTVAAAEKLGIDGDFVAELKEKMAKIKPFKVGSKGQLLEWDSEYEESQIHHRHVSHLYGLHPAGLINYDKNPDLIDACKKTLEIRGDNGTGWSLGWKINFWARLRDGNHALKLIELQLRHVPGGNGIKYHKGGGTYDNLFDAHPPFQIDGNFGYVSGITEMLMQSAKGEIIILPALPDSWKNGSIKGLLAKGNITVDISWKDGKLAELCLCGTGETTVSYNGKTVNVKLDGKKTSVKI